MFYDENTNDIDLTNCTISDVRAFLDSRRTTEQQLTEEYEDNGVLSLKFQIVRFVKAIKSLDINSPLFKKSTLQMTNTQELSQFDKLRLIKHPVKVSLNHQNAQHLLSCEFGEGLFADPRKLIDPNIGYKMQYCHGYAYLFTKMHPELKPQIQTGFYNRQEESLNGSKGYLHSICVFPFKGESKVFDGSHGIVMDERLYKALFNFKMLSCTDYDKLQADLPIILEKDVSLLEYFLAPSVVFNAIEEGAYYPED